MTKRDQRWPFIKNGKRKYFASKRKVIYWMEHFKNLKNPALGKVGKPKINDALAALQEEERRRLQYNPPRVWSYPRFRYKIEKAENSLKTLGGFSFLIPRNPLLVCAFARDIPS